MTEQAACSHCGKKYSKKNLRPAPDGGAICKDWFECQRRRDLIRAEIPRRLKRVV